MLKTTLCVVLLSVISSSLAKKSMPSYVKPCSLSDPKLEECIIKHGHEAAPFIAKGDKEYKIPNMFPLKLDKVQFNHGSLKITFTEMEVSGLETAKIISAGYVQKEQKMYFNLRVPRVDIKAHYETKGRILVLPFEGSGPSQIVLIDGEYNCTAFLDNFAPGSTKPIQYKDSKVEFYVQKSHYNFENLFNGNKQLGDNVNNVLNENHENLNMEFNGVFAETINSVIKSIVTGIINDIYFEDVFLP